jgi:hypothetical protein
MNSGCYTFNTLFVCLFLAGGAHKWPGPKSKWPGAATLSSFNKLRWLSGPVISAVLCSAGYMTWKGPDPLVRCRLAIFQIC